MHTIGGCFIRKEGSVYSFHEKIVPLALSLCALLVKTTHGQNVVLTREAYLEPPAPIAAVVLAPR